MSCRYWLLIVSGIVVHTVDVFGVVVEYVGQIVDGGYEVGGGWASNFFVVRIPILSVIIGQDSPDKERDFSEFMMSPKGEC